LKAEGGDKKLQEKNPEAVTLLPWRERSELDTLQGFK